MHKIQFTYCALESLKSVRKIDLPVHKKKSVFSVFRISCCMGQNAKTYVLTSEGANGMMSHHICMILHTLRRVS